MSDQRPKIRRYRYSATKGTIEETPSGQLVIYVDCLRAVTLAKIEVLEALLLEEMVPMRHSNGYAVRAVPQVSFLNKIAALRKELGE